MWRESEKRVLFIENEPNASQHISMLGSLFFAILRTQQEKQTALESALLYEQRLINRIYELSHYRSQGLRTFKEADMYELDRKKRLSEIQLRAAKEPAYRSGLKATNRGSRYVNRDRPVGSPVVSSTSSNTRLQAAWSPEGFTSSEMLSSSSKEKESSAGKIVKVSCDRALFEAYRLRTDGEKPVCMFVSPRLRRRGAKISSLLWM